MRFTIINLDRARITSITIILLTVRFDVLAFTGRVGADIRERPKWEGWMTANMFTVMLESAIQDSTEVSTCYRKVRAFTRAY